MLLRPRTEHDGRIDQGLPKVPVDFDARSSLAWPLSVSKGFARLAPRWALLFWFE